MLDFAHFSLVVGRVLFGTIAVHQDFQICCHI